MGAGPQGLGSLCGAETQGPAPIYKLATLLWLHGHGGEEFEVHDDVSPTGKSGGLAMMGRVRNWARLVKGKVTFDRQAEPTTEFAPDEVDLIAQAAGRVSHAVEIDSPAPGNARTAAVSLPGGSGLGAVACICERIESPALKDICSE